MRLPLFVITISLLCLGNNSYAEEDEFVYGSGKTLNVTQKQLPKWVTNNLALYEDHFVVLCEGGAASMERYLREINNIFKSQSLPPEEKLKLLEEERRKFKSGSGINIGEYLQGCLAPLVPVFIQ